MNQPPALELDMGTYPRLGSSLLVARLAGDPLGALHRGVVHSGGSFERHVTVRSFSEELLQAGLGDQLAASHPVADLLSGLRPFGLGLRVESGKTPHICWDHVPGRSLAQLIDQARQDQVPFGLEHALTVIQGLALGAVQMQAKGLSHGLISPHSVWVGFDGTIQLLDAPLGPLAASLLRGAPSARQQLAPYLQGPDDAFRRDLFALGAIFYELLTFECLPVGAGLQAALDQITLQAAQEDTPLPGEIRAFLGRLLLGVQPFASEASFSAELERLLYEGDSCPSTFSLAFFMHALFREEIEREAAARRAEQNEDYFVPAAAGEAMRSEPPSLTPMEGLTEPRPRQKSAMLFVAGLIAVVVLGLGYFYLNRHRVEPAAQKPLEASKSLPAKAEPQKADPEPKAAAEGAKAAQPQKPLTETRPAEEKPKAPGQAEEARQRLLELERQQKAAERRLDEQRKKEQRLAAEGKPAEPPPAPDPPKLQPKPLP